MSTETPTPPATKRRPLARHMIEFAFLCGLIATVGAFATIIAASRAASHTDQKRESEERRDAATRLETSVRKIEAPQLGYLVTGPAEGGGDYIVAYRAAAAELESNADALVRAANTDTNHTRHARARTVADLARERRGDCDFVFAECDAGRKLYAVQHVRVGRGRELSHRFVTAVTEFARIEDCHRLEAERYASAYQRELYVGICLWSAMSVLFCCFVPFVYRDWGENADGSARAPVAS